MAPPPTDPTVLLAVVEAQSEIASAELDLDAVIALSCAKAQELTGADGAVVLLTEGDEVVNRAAGGSAEGYAGRRVPGCERVDAASQLCVPLVDRGDAVGVLKVSSRHRDAFGARDEDTLNLLSGLIAAQTRHAQVYARAEEASREDSLTGLSNPRAYHERLDAEVARAIRHGRPLTVCLVELEGVDALAADHGPKAVDAALVRIARALCTVRACDQAFRVGDTRFALLLFETDEYEAEVVLRRLHATLAVRDASGIPISVLTARKRARNRDPQVLLDSVEAELRRARRVPHRLASAA